MKLCKQTSQACHLSSLEKSFHSNMYSTTKALRSLVKKGADASPSGGKPMHLQDQDSSKMTTSLVVNSVSTYKLKKQIGIVFS